MINDLSFCNQVRQKTSPSFQFEDNYESLCYKFHPQDIEEQNLKFKTERIETLVEDYTDDIKSLMETQYPINCPENDSKNVISTLSTPILNLENHSETEESLDDIFDKEEETDKTHTT